MARRIDARSLFAKVANTMMVVLTALCGGINGTPLNRVVDESAQLNAFDSHVEEKSMGDSDALARRRSARLTPGRQGSPIRDASRFASTKADDAGIGAELRFDATPRTSFGAGSTALSSLGHNASMPHLLS
jgi:hypothetical protein